MTWLAPSLVAVALGAAAILVAVLDRIGRQVAESATIAVSALVLAGCVVLVRQAQDHGATIVWFGGWHPGNTVGLGIAFAIDLASALVATLVATIVLAATVFSRDYFAEVGTIFYVLLLAMLGAMIAFAFAADAFNLFIFYEIFSVAAYALSAYRIEAKSAYEGALQFALTNTVAGLFILFGIILLEGRTGELNLAAIGHSLAAQHARDALSATAFAFVAIGLFTRGALAPLHFWFDEVHASAPTPLCAILSGAMVPLALYGFVRFYWATFSAILPPAPMLQTIVISIGSLSALVGSVMCLREPHLKRALAYSTVAHAGIAVSALGTFRADDIGGAGLYLATYALGAAGLFMAVAILRARTDEVDLRKLAGCGRTLPLTAAVFALGTCDIAGAWLAGGAIATPALVVVGAATGGAFVRAFFIVFLAPSKAPGARSDVPWFMLAPAFSLTSIPLVLALWAPAGNLAITAAYRITNRTAYEIALLGHGAGPAALHAAAAPLPLALGAPVGALLVAAFTLARLPIAGFIRVRLMRSVPLIALAKLHDGDSGQYIGWIVATAALAASVLTIHP